MARCTAPVYGHRSSAAAANCPACRGRSRYGGYSRYDYESFAPRSYTPITSYSSSGGSSRSGSSKPRWSPGGSPFVYTETEIRALSPIRSSVEEQGAQPDRRDVFLCHAWDDRNGAAKELHDRLEARGVSVWFSEKDVALGSPLLREIDKGLAKSRVGIVLVTPAFLRRVQGEGIAEKELSALLARELLVPIIHETTYEALRNVSPLLGSRAGLNTGDDTMPVVAGKIKELVSV